ncbi:hypothetical protein THRCLA_04878 [Thraustotheca clavata]|uniref:Uncharacterized protein n=1 Tax=Thraustotheca clavata TaxID=74557 RepID=A0A1V9ZXV6_9STRA|nr:hypothetical protein THRCLA_04878 [Thraustotheca clavata]
MDPREEEEMNEQEEKKQDQVQEDEAKETTPHVPTVLEDEEKIEYRSISIMAMPTQFGFGHMHQASVAAPPALTSMRARTTAKEPRIAMLDPTNYTKVTPQVLPPAPFRLEMHSHFHVKGAELRRACITIGQKLMDMGSEFIFKAEKAKWKVTRIHGASWMKANVKLYKSGNDYIAEFQRREGDIVSMMEVYGEVVEACKNQRVLAGSGAVKPTTLKRPAPFATPKKITVATTQVQDAVLSVEEMMNSTHTDVQLQGVLASVSLASTPNYKDIMATLVPHLVGLTKSSNQKLVICASFALARLCDDPECRRVFMNCDGWQVIMTMAAGGADIATELQRESLHILENLCPLYYNELANTQGASAVLEVIQHWESIVDPRLKKHACGAHRALQSAGLLA